VLIDAATDNIRVLERTWAPPSPAVVNTLAGVPVANIGDSLDRMGLMGSRIKALAPGACVGPALTVWTREGDNLAIHRAMDEAQPGDVLVVNGAGDANRALWGDILAARAIRAGVIGLIVDGCVRDVQSMAADGFPVWGVGVSPAGPTKNGPGLVGGPVACGGVVVRSGDLIAADGDGVAVIPLERAEDVAAEVKRIEAFEASLRVRILEDGAHA
jgi:regulator of RNase E activity RraA